MPERIDASPRGEAAHQFFMEVQTRITSALEAQDGVRRFEADTWERPGGGGGRTMVLAGGPVIEKGGVNVSCVYGALSESFAAELPGVGRGFFATGISLVIHPRSPQVPTVHANFRYLEKGRGDQRVCWFGGGADLTPWILYEDDAIHFHRTWQRVCDRHSVADYVRFKKWCDDYFFLPHRDERRGIGGIFFDYLGLDADRGTPADPEEVFVFVRDAADRFVEAYLPIVIRRKALAYTDAERDWQLRRRSRYVEFNLLYDRGTRFGLRTGGRVESILMSLPSIVCWNYGDGPDPGTGQAELVDVLRTPRDWLEGPEGGGAGR